MEAVAAAVGVALIALRKPYARHVLRFQRDVMRHDFGRRSQRTSEAVCAIAGLAAVVFAILSCLGRLP